MGDYKKLRVSSYHLTAVGVTQQSCSRMDNLRPVGTMFSYWVLLTSIRDYMFLHLILPFAVWYSSKSTPCHFSTMYLCQYVVCCHLCVSSRAAGSAVFGICISLPKAPRWGAIKSSVYFFFPTPKELNSVSPRSADGQSASHRSALRRRACSQVYMSCSFHCFRSFFTALWLPPWADTCAVIPVAANRMYMLICTQEIPLYTKRAKKSLDFGWYLYILPKFSSIFSTFPSCLIPMYPTHSAPCVLSSVLRWRGRILFMGRAIWGACHMAEVIRSSTGEEMMSTAP